jgi:hypothetical protein
LFSSFLSDKLCRLHKNGSLYSGGSYVKQRFFFWKDEKYSRVRPWRLYTCVETETLVRFGSKHRLSVLASLQASSIVLLCTLLSSLTGISFRAVVSSCFILSLSEAYFEFQLFVCTNLSSAYKQVWAYHVRTPLQFCIMCSRSFYNSHGVTDCQDSRSVLWVPIYGI